MNKILNRCLALILLAFNVYAVPTVVTLVKNSCWMDSTLNFEIHDKGTGKYLGGFVIPKNQVYGRVQIETSPNQDLLFQTSFSPPIFKKDEGRFYSALKDKIMPGMAPSAGSLWELDYLCFDKDFANVPMPLQATGSCSCDFSRIPPVKVMEILEK